MKKPITREHIYLIHKTTGHEILYGYNDFANHFGADACFFMDVDAFIDKCWEKDRDNVAKRFKWTHRKNENKHAREIKDDHLFDYRIDKYTLDPNYFHFQLQDKLGDIHIFPTASSGFMEYVPSRSCKIEKSEVTIESCKDVCIRDDKSKIRTFPDLASATKYCEYFNGYDNPEREDRSYSMKSNKA